MRTRITAAVIALAATASQHPEEDENSDQFGSNRLGPSPMDGGKVMFKEIGFNSNPNAPVEIFAVPPSITHASGFAKLTVHARPNQPAPTILLIDNVLHERLFAALFSF